jgi:hypothetical protein
MFPWLFSARFDGAWILAPLFLPALVVYAFQNQLGVVRANEPLLFLFVVVGVDVAHVYSSLFRTYFDPVARSRHGTLFSLVPLFSFVGLALLFSLGDIYFWRTLAYVAAFHFVRQQFGFHRLYARHESVSQARSRLHDVAIHAATLGPLVAWHTGHPRVFQWFTPGDFLTFPAPQVGALALGISAACVTASVLVDVVSFVRGMPFNVPRNAVLVGTALTWWVGIVALNDDAAFTLTNVLSHGIPYFAIVYGTRTSTLRGNSRGVQTFTGLGVVAFLGVPLALAYGEEWLWHVAIWKERFDVFPAGERMFQSAPLSPETLALVAAALATPQATHYILDGFIWRRPRGSPLTVEGLQERH